MKTSLERFRAWTLVVAILLAIGGTREVQAEVPPKIAAVSTAADVTRNSITNILQGGLITQVASPMVPLKSGANPEHYMVTLNRHVDGRTVRALTLMLDRKGRHAEYNEVVIKDGKTLPIAPNYEAEVSGRKLRNYMIQVSDATYLKWVSEGVDLTFKGKSGSFPVIVPAFVFAAMEELFKGGPNVAGGDALKMGPKTATLVPATTAARKAEMEPATVAQAATPEQQASSKALAKTVSEAVVESAPSPFLRSGSIGKKPAESNGKTVGEFQLPKLAEAQLVGQELLFLPVSPKLQKRAYEYAAFSELGSIKKVLPYDKYVGRTLLVKSCLTISNYHAAKYGEGKLGRADQIIYRGGTVYETVVKETGEAIDMVVGIVGAGTPWKYLVLRRDLEFAQAKLLQRKLWLNTTTLYGYDAEKDVQTTFTVPKWGAVEVVDVVLGTDANPVRLILKDAGMQEYFLDVQVSPQKDTAVGSDFFGHASVCVPVEKVLLTFDPRLKYQWPEEVMKLVVQNKIGVGLTPEQVRAAWGEPTSISQSAIGASAVIYWTYDKTLVAFENGKCRSIIEQ